MNYNSREKIIETATRLVRQYGYEAITVNQIISESRTSKGSFYYHFPNGKDDVVLEVLRMGYTRAVDGSRSILARHEDLVEAFSYLVGLMIEDVQNGNSEELVFPSLSVIALEAADVAPAITEACNNIYLALRKVFGEKVLQSGAYSPEEAHYLGTLLQTAFGGAIVASCSSKSTDALTTLRDGFPLMFHKAKASDD